MKQVILFLLALLSFLFTKGQQNTEEALRKELQLAYHDLEMLTYRADSLEVRTQELAYKLDEIRKVKSGALMHVVFLNIKDGLAPSEKQEILETLHSLERIEEVMSLKVGELINTGDNRAGSTKGMVLHMLFLSDADLATYQKNEFHLEQRKKLGKYMAGPPVVYDYKVE